MTLSAWWLLLLAVPVILLGELLVRHVRVLSRFSIPVPVVGGLIVALAMLTLNLAGVQVAFGTRVSAGWWTWISLAEPQWAARPASAVQTPLMVAFFTCIGLNASWAVARRGSWQLLLFLALATALVVIQNLIGVGLARAMNVSPLLGLVCGSVTMTGGHGTAAGFAETLESAGLPHAGLIGAAAATFGLIGGSLIGGPIATLRIRQVRRRLALPPTIDVPPPPGHASAVETFLEPPYGATPEGPLDQPVPSGFIGDLRRLARLGKSLAVHLLIIAACIKLGAWISLGLVSAKLTFPVYIGAMVCGIVVRNALDALGRPLLRTETVDLLASIFLSLFLAIAMASLNLIELSSTAGPMLVVLGTQTLAMALFAYFVTFNVMGRDYDAAVMAGGHCGFGMGATPNAVANMEALAERFGHAPRAFLVVTIVGAFLIDFTNSTTITLFLNLLR